MPEAINSLDPIELKSIRGVIEEIIAKSSHGQSSYIYRGEPEIHETVSSGLYRKYRKFIEEGLDIRQLEEEIAETAKAYTNLKDKLEILTQVQHFGGVTNLIDFTADYVIGLFFACVGDNQKDGRVIISPSGAEGVVTPKNINSRIIAQKSAFVRPERGFFVPDPDREVVVIPGSLKNKIISYLRRFHNVSSATVYNDIQGFVKNQHVDRSEYISQFTENRNGKETEEAFDPKILIEKGVMAVTTHENNHGFHQRGIVYRDRKGSSFWIDTVNVGEDGEFLYNGPTTKHFLTYRNVANVISLFTWVIEKFPSSSEAYCVRGNAYLEQEKIDCAARDFDRAIELDKDCAEAYHERGNMYRAKNETNQAMKELNKSLKLKPDLTDALIDRGNLYRELKILKSAIKDYEKALHFAKKENSNRQGEVHLYRAIAWCASQCWNKAKLDLRIAKEQGILPPLSFNNICGSIRKFETEFDVKMPSDMVTELYKSG